MNQEINRSNQQLMGDIVYKEEFLKLCKKFKYTDVVVGKIKHPNIPDSYWWSENSNSSYVIANKKSKDGKNLDNRYDGWPAIWKIVEILNISGGAGNSHQHQIKYNSMCNGAYTLINDEWVELEVINGIAILPKDIKNDK